MRHRVSLLVAAATALVVAGCGATKPTEPNFGVASVPGTAPTPTVANPALATKPTVPRPAGAAPKSLVVKDLVPGTGAAAKAGSNVSVQYVGVLYADGKQFDSSWDRGKQPFTFALGQGSVIKGWDQGLLGMKVGGRRELIIPASLAYGAQGSPPKIGPNQPLIFVIDLLSVQ